MAKFTWPTIDGEKCKIPLAVAEQLGVVVFASDIETLEIKKKSFENLRVSFFLSNIGTLIIEDDAFLGCIGTIWMRNVTNKILGPNVHSNSLLWMFDQNVHKLNSQRGFNPSMDTFGEKLNELGQ